MSNNIVDMTKRRQAQIKAEDKLEDRRKTWKDLFRRGEGMTSGDRLGDQPTVGGALRAREDNDDTYAPTYERGSKDDPWMND